MFQFVIFCQKFFTKEKFFGKDFFYIYEIKFRVLLSVKFGHSWTVRLSTVVPPKSVLELTLFQLNIRKHSTRRNANEFLLPRPKTENYGKQTLTYLCTKIWNMLPKELQKSPSLFNFNYDCPCKLCKTYIPNLGYI